MNFRYHGRTFRSQDKHLFLIPYIIPRKVINKVVVYDLEYVFMQVGLFKAMSSVMALTTESHKVADNILALTPSGDVMNVHSLCAADLTRHKVLFTVTEVVIIYFAVIVHNSICVCVSGPGM